MKKTLSILMALCMILSICSFQISAAPQGTAITSEAEFLAMKADGSYYLANDLTITKSYGADGTLFTGYFDGNGKTITGLNVTVTRNGGGFFGELQPIEGPDWPGRDDGRVEIPPQPTQPIVTHGEQPTPDMSVQGEDPTIPEMPAGDPPADMPMPDFGGSDPSQMPVPPMPADGENMPMPQPPQEGFGRQPIGSVVIGVLSTDFPITPGANYFTNLRPVE